MKHVLTIGEILVEIMALDPGNGFLEPISLIGPFASGAPAIFIDQVARLGQPCGIIGCVGNDDFGELCLQRLQADGVDIGAVARDPERPTGSAFVRYRPDGQRDFVFNIRHSACGSMAASEASQAAIRGCDHLHVMGTSLFSESLVEMTTGAIQTVRARGGTISFDPNIRGELLELPGLREALKSVAMLADLFMPSGQELFLFSQARTESHAVAEVLDWGARAVVVKRGTEGASYFDREQTMSVPAIPVREVDPTGAGDCFGATFVTCWLRGMPPERALSLANAAGAMAVLKKGPMEGVSTMGELQAFLEAGEGRK
ncbi:sugar kinase [Mesorhizobium sp. ES1-1]|uniref:tagatose kinase n=1 Tax=Mesorhizobium sp. ES1-1 TaxID=2876629 RepID=UPI001CCAB415|nr:sugar kinase [Mesorhizobium sp. ES1-1]MBZ9677181.1 sugar kinase [Mesorhizobium sp. ES1-1]